jgi:hypothetical protein
VLSEKASVAIDPFYRDQEVLGAITVEVRAMHGVGHVGLALDFLADVRRRFYPGGNRRGQFRFGRTGECGRQEERNRGKPGSISHVGSSVRILRARSSVDPLPMTQR